jgi:hypothetical protein
MFRNLWENIRKDMPKKERGRGEDLGPLMLSTRLQTAMRALYGHYEKTLKLWAENGIKVPPNLVRPRRAASAFSRNEGRTRGGGGEGIAELAAPSREDTAS